MLSEGACIVGSEVHLIVVRTCHGAVEHITILDNASLEVVGIQIIEVRIVACSRSIEMFSATVALSHLIEGVV